MKIFLWEPLTDRPYIFRILKFIENPQLKTHSNPYPKLENEVENSILNKMLNHGQKLRKYLIQSGKVLYYHSGGRYWRKALLNKISSHYKPISVLADHYSIVFSLLNSQFFYWYWISNSNCMDVVSREVLDFPVFSLIALNDNRFNLLMNNLLKSYFSSNIIRKREGKIISVEEINFDVKKSKNIIDKIDRVLAGHYGFTDEELDFIINYDI